MPGHPARRLIDAQGNITRRLASFGPEADISPTAQRSRASQGTKPFPSSFIFDSRTLPSDFFTALNNSPFRIRPDPHRPQGNAIATGSAIATEVISALLYYAQFHVSLRAREYVMESLRFSGKYDGDLLDALARIVVEEGGRGGMRGYRGDQLWRDTMWEAGSYYTANGIQKLTAQAMRERG
jgi:hypothetical protein